MRNKGGKKMLTLKEVNAIFKNLRAILAMLDKIYHALESEDNNFQTSSRNKEGNA